MIRILSRIAPTRPVRLAAPIQTSFQTAAFASKRSARRSGQDDQQEGSAENAFSADRYAADMQKALDWASRELAALRAGRASVALLQPVRVAHAGQNVPLSKAATISLKDAHNLLVTVFEEQLISPVEKAIRNAGLNLNPQKISPTTLKVPVPKASKEAKEQAVSQINQIANSAKTRFRSIRGDARTALRRAALPSEQNKSSENDIQKLTDKYCEMIDAAAASKSKEIL